MLALLSMVARADAGGLKLEWSFTFNGDGNAADRAEAVALGSSGHVLVAGYETRTDLAEKENWRVIELDAKGSLVWSVSWNGSRNDTDIAYGVAVVPSVGILVAGISTTYYGGQDWLVRKYGTDGSLITSTTYDADNGDDIAWGIAAVPGGDFVVAGCETTKAEAKNWSVRRYCSCGGLKWSLTVNGDADGNDEANAVAADTSGGVVAAGYIDNGATKLDMVIMKFNVNGTTAWTQTVETADDEAATGVALDASGNVWMAGWQNVGGDNYGWRIHKYDSSGSTLWSASYDNPSADGTTCPLAPPPPPYPDDRPAGIAVDARGNVIVVGWEQVAPQPACAPPWVRNWLIRIYGPSGTLIASTTYMDPSNLDGRATSVAADACGNIYVAGWQTWPSGAGGENWMVRKYSRPGWGCGGGGGGGEETVAGPALDRNVFRPSRGETLKVRIRPASAEPPVAVVYTASGRMVRQLYDFRQDGNGGKSATWDGRNEDGVRVVRGVYLVRLSGGGNPSAILKVVVK